MSQELQERLRYSFRASYKLMIDALNAGELLPECITRNLVSFDEKASIASVNGLHTTSCMLGVITYMLPVQCCNRGQEPSD